MSDDSKHKNSDNLLLPFGIYARFIEDIKHYDSVQATYRTMTSSLLLATFAAIGYLFSIDPTSFPLNVTVWVVFISAISLAIITTLAIIDLFLQERLMIANAIEMLKFEAKYKWLPKIQHRMLNLESHPASPNKKAWYYIGCANSLILIIGLSIIYSHGIALNLFNVLVFSLTILATLIYGYILRRASKSFEEIIKDHFNYSEIKKMKF